MRGLIVRQPYASRLVAGTKKHEYRSSALRILGEDVHVVSGGYSIGIVMFDSSIQCNPGRHHGYGHAWHVARCKRHRPKKVKIKKGTQVWIRNVEFV